MGANCCNQQSTTTSDQVLDVPVLESTYDDEGGQKKREFHDGLYFGQLTGTRRNGFGTMEYTNGDKYEGEWVENDRQGTGLVNYSGSQNSFKGEWFQDKPHGRGVYQSQDDEKFTYDGEFFEGNFHGDGKKVWPNKDQYEGQFEHNRVEGKGTFRFAEAEEQFQGEFMNGKWHGTGTYTWKDGSTFDGQWTNGKKHGNGTYLFADRRQYKGQYENDDKHGRGAFTWPDGRGYDGEWRNNKKHGSGIAIAADGTKSNVIFDNDKIQQ